MLPMLGARSFHAAAPALWNSLPAQLREIQSLAVFKQKLKTHLFRAAFRNCYLWFYIRIVWIYIFSFLFSDEYFVSFNTVLG